MSCLVMLVLSCLVIAGFAVVGIGGEEGFIPALMEEFGAIVDGDSRDAPAESVAESPEGPASEPAVPAEDGGFDAAAADERFKGYYYYNRLDYEDRQKYQVMCDMLEQRRSVGYPSANGDDISHIYRCVLSDHPEYFYVKGISTRTILGEDTSQIEGTYLFSPDQISEYAPLVDAAIAECIAGIPEGADDYAKAKHVYEYLVMRVTYDHEASWLNGAEQGTYLGQTVVDSLVQGRAVCAGYARAFQLIMQRLDIECAYVSGELLDGSSHSWCLAKLDGEYYYIDPTWGDPSYYADDGSVGEDDGADYSYLNFTTADALRTRSIDAWQPLPECTSVADNYYVREGRLLEVADYALVQQWWDEALAGAGSIQFRCADSDLYEQVKGDLQAGMVLVGGWQYTYSYDDGMLTVSISVY